MYKALNLLFLILIFIFFFKIYNYYSSNKNLKAKDFNLKNIDLILDKKTSQLMALPNDTDDVIEFNNSLNDNIKKDKPRSFWNLLKIK